jgi:FlaA1/EpsC-like NDP-sugar epimerase
MKRRSFALSEEKFLGLCCGILPWLIIYRSNNELINVLEILFLIFVLYNMYYVLCFYIERITTMRLYRRLYKKYFFKLIIRIVSLRRCLAFFLLVLDHLPLKFRIYFICWSFFCFFVAKQRTISCSPILKRGAGWGYYLDIVNKIICATSAGTKNRLVLASQVYNYM